MDLVAALSSELGIDPARAQAAAGTVFAALKEQVPAADFQSLMDRVPEVGEWLGAASAASRDDEGLRTLLGSLGGVLGGGSAGSGMLGGLLGMARQVAGGAMVANALSRLGVGPEATAKAAGLLMEFLQSRAPDLVPRLLSVAPLLGAIADLADTRRND